MSNSGDWFQFYNQNLYNTTSSGAGTLFSDRFPDATVVSTTSGAGNTSAPTGLSPDGRVGKPVRRRSRASRRTPTTLLNTDTTNFRAMVQQFTGGPATPFATPVPNPGSASFTLGRFAGLPQPSLGNPPAIMASPASGYVQQQQFYLHGQNPPEIMFPAINTAGVLQRLPETGPGNGGVSSQIPSTMVPADSVNESNGGNGSFLF